MWHICCSKVKQLLTTDESISHIAVQKKYVAGSIPDAVVLTNRRVIIYCPKMFGRVNFNDVGWRSIRNAHLEENLLGSTLSFRTTSGKFLKLSKLPKAVSRKLYAYAQEREEQVKEERRVRDLEEKRAAAGAVVMNAAPGALGAPEASKEDPTERLQKLLQLKESGLITETEYDSKRAEIVQLL